MLAGEDGPGGIDFDDFKAAETLGAAAPAVVLCLRPFCLAWQERSFIAWVDLRRPL